MCTAERVYMMAEAWLLLGICVWCSLTGVNKHAFLLNESSAHWRHTCWVWRALAGPGWGCRAAQPRHRGPLDLPHACMQGCRCAHVTASAGTDSRMGRCRSRLAWPPPRPTPPEVPVRGCHPWGLARRWARRPRRRSTARAAQAWPLRRPQALPRPRRPTAPSASSARCTAAWSCT